ncbi:cardiolipin synthase [Sansalvadorimonas sp. 2012CJ34-2]|uniref:Cardiolipin synthase A n=1 Tax=Parendozoicomonas callyspongiae TaxID=2942213 RepID=A0ABT0PHS7_9GAMM|nr:cardiolipin synthase [Sansalvadorimonas sp. 2012CJ34-2]MCL6270895.1 cardiolipin synthase [Sansalvadorimonas sp. 2012CJ34-2]
MQTETQSISLIFSTIAGFVYFLITSGFAITVIMKRRPVGVTLSWLLLLFLLPIAGIILFLMFGTRRLGSKRLRRAEAMAPTYSEWFHHLQQVLQSQEQQAFGSHNRVYQLTQNTLRIPGIPGNSLTLFHQTDEIFSALIRDIEQSTSSIYLEFYICQQGGQVNRVLSALEAAAQRGVRCHLLLDNVGSRQFLSSTEALRLRVAGIKIRSSMPVGPVRMLFERMDLRNHRKLVVIDDAIAWTGSLNLIDPALFKQDAGVGQWVDAMVRIEGPAAHVSGALVMYDWEIETGEEVKSIRQAYKYEQPLSNEQVQDSAAIHIVPSGPGVDRELIHQVLLAAAYESQHELIITTPYFVPDDALVTALCSAAMRGVEVTLVVPEKNDSRMVHYASRSYYEDLLNAGIKIMHFTAGLLHTKCVLVDRETVLFGTVNLDMRSVWLNFELTLIVYNPAFGQHMATLMESYIYRSNQVAKDSWQTRPYLQRLAENSAQLLSPLL